MGVAPVKAAWTARQSFLVRARTLASHYVVVSTLFLAMILSLAFRDVVFGGKSLVAGQSAPGVMGGAPSYGYNGAPRASVFRPDPGASAWQNEPLTRKAHEAYAHLHFPLWNANAGAGTPLLADMITAPFDPLRLPIFISPNPTAWDVYLLGRYLIGALFALFFARAMQLGIPGSLVVAVGYVLSGFFLLFSNNPYLDVYFSLPLVLCGVELIIRRKRPGAVLLLAAAVALNLLSGLPEASFLTLLLAGGYALYRLGTSTIEERKLPSARRRLILLFVGFSAGFALAMPSLLPFREYFSSAYTIHSSTRLLGLAAVAPRWALGLLVPYVNGPPLRPAQGGGLFFSDRNYVGVVLPLLAVLGVWHHPLARRAGWFFMAAAFLGLAKSYGLPGVNELGRLPLANITIFNAWLGPVIAFCVAVLAGLGTDRVYRGERPGWSLHVAAGAVLVALVSLLLMNRNLLPHLPPEPLLWLRLALGMIAVTWLVLWAAQGSSGRRLSWVCLALVSGELLLFTPHGIYADRYDTFTRPPYVDFLQAQQQQEDRSRLFGADGLLYPNDASAYGLDDIRFLNALTPDRYFGYVREFVSPSVADRFVGGPASPGEMPANISSNPMFDLLGVKYVLTGQKGLQLQPPSSLIDDVVKRLGVSPAHAPTVFEIDGDRKPTLSAHAPSDVPLDVRVTPAHQILLFSAAIEPGAWQGTAGVNFQVLAGAAGSAEQVVWEQLIDPANNPADRRWVDGAVNLAPFGQQVRVILRTLPNGIGGNNAYDWAGWGTPRLISPPEVEQFQLIYDKEIRIYQNKDALPRAFALHRVAEVANGKAGLAEMHRPDYDPRLLAVVEGTLSGAERNQLSASPETDASSVTMRSYADAKVDLTASMEHAGLVLLTDTYYPGWKAYLDGKRVPIRETDYAFRGVFVPRGQHNLVFEYDPASFKIGVLIALLTAFGLTAWWGHGRLPTVRPLKVPVR